MRLMDKVLVKWENCYVIKKISICCKKKLFYGLNDVLPSAYSLSYSLIFREHSTFATLNFREHSPGPFTFAITILNY